MMGLPQLNYLFNANTNLAKMLLIRHIFELEDALVEDGLYVGSLDDPDLCILFLSADPANDGDNATNGYGFQTLRDCRRTSNLDDMVDTSASLGELREEALLVKLEVIEAALALNRPRFVLLSYGREDMGVTHGLWVTGRINTVFTLGRILDSSYYQ
ncbi:hypothetical protein HG531_002628 [Fusarium graminearum]|nr:hypothetical protein HG531_002628 [Fusarium graminearum]